MSDCQRQRCVPCSVKNWLLCARASDACLTHMAASRCVYTVFSWHVYMQMPNIYPPCCDTVCIRDMPSLTGGTTGTNIHQESMRALARNHSPHLFGKERMAKHAMGNVGAYTLDGASFCCSVALCYHCAQPSVRIAVCALRSYSSDAMLHCAGNITTRRSTTRGGFTCLVRGP